MKKIFFILVSIIICAAMLFKLMAHKNAAEMELAAMQNYTSSVPVQIAVPQQCERNRITEEHGVLKAESEISVLSETSGKVLNVLVNVGDQVAAHQVLAHVEKEVIESQFLLAASALDNAEKDLNRYTKLAGGDAITLQQLEASKTAFQNAKANYTALKKQLENSTVKSPVAGIIAKKLVDKGTFIVPTVPLFSIVEQKKMILEVKCTGMDISNLSRGETVSATIDAYGTALFEGTIRTVGVVPDLSGRFAVEITLQNNSRQFIPGMIGTARFEHHTDSNAFILPRKCLTGSIKDASVFIKNGETVMLKKISAEPLNEKEIIVKSGINRHDTIILSGQINLRDGSTVKVLQ